MITIDREPTPPGVILDEEFLKPLCITKKQLVDHIGCDVRVINKIENNRSLVSAEMAVKLASAFRISPEFLLNAQQAGDVFKARQKVTKVPEHLIQSKQQ
jgi:addiction module HigA family antidote